MVDVRSIAILVAIIASIGQEEGYYSIKNLSRRNNNPGNLRNTMGFNGVVVDGYAHFATPLDGWEAAVALYEKHRDKGDTLEQFVYMWAPPTENNTEAYISLVEQLSGVKRTEKI